MAKAETPIKVGSKVRVTNHGKGKVKGFAGENGEVVYVELDTGEEVTAAKAVVKRVEAEE